ncbi:hypothetical protein ES703_77491 [subsurface metagenome]
MLERHEWQRKRSEINALSKGSVEIRPYRDTDFADFLNIHPQGAYFNAHYIVQNIDGLHSLIMAVLDDRVDNTAAFRLYQRLGFKETITYLAYELKF